MSALVIVKPGMLTTIQDRGRWGYQAEGVPVAGPMDLTAHRAANALVGNDPGAAALEVTLLGPELAFEDERGVAITGAEFDVLVNGRAVAHNRGFVVPRGGVVRFGRRVRGSRAYVAVAGGIDVPPTLGSRATHLISAMGGLDGRPLAAGQRLPLGVPRRRTPIDADATTHLPPLPGRHATIRVLLGPQDDYFSPAAVEALQSSPYTISNKSDRMGFRLDGPVLLHARGADIISDATPLGVLQVPASGQPILLMADRQTAGGYPKIATAITADMATAGQLGPGDTISFRVCPAREALAALIAQERALMALEAAASRTQTEHGVGR